MSQNKYNYLHVLQANYGDGHGWEDELQSEDLGVIRQHLREYHYLREFCGNVHKYTYRIIKRREVKAGGSTTSNG